MALSDKTVKTTLAETLENLSKENFKKFCHQLLDRRQEPRIRCNQVEGKDYLDVTDALVSTYTEAGAVRVTGEILERICCNEAAQSLVEATFGSQR